MSEYQEADVRVQDMPKAAARLMTAPPPKSGPELMASADQLIATGRCGISCWRAYGSESMGLGFGSETMSDGVPKEWYT